MADCRRAVVVGGSLGGLVAALWLSEVGFEVSVHERSRQLADRGAGIIAHPETLRYLNEHGLADLDEVSIAGGNLRYIDDVGRLLSDEPSGYRFTSWFAVYARLLRHLPAGAMHFGQALECYEDDGSTVTVRLSGGRELRCDLLVCADGIRSAARERLAPGVRAAYAGYIGWRGTVPVGGLPPRLRLALGGHITYQLLDAGHILAYPIPGPGGATSDGGGAVNWIWYRPCTAGAELTAAMTDSQGREHDLSVPPGRVAGAAEVELREAAASRLAGDLAALVQGTASPFIQRIVDIEVPRMADGRVCVVGDAAFVARPHAAAGTAKAADDGRSLAAALAGGDDIADSLRRWNHGQMALGRNLVSRSRTLGESQLRGEWIPGDSALRFGLRAPGDSCFDAAGTTAQSAESPTPRT